jgi:hypothetical protein
MALVSWFNAAIGLYAQLGASLLTAALARTVVSLDHHAHSQWRA